VQDVSDALPMPKAAFGEVTTNRFQPKFGSWTGWSAVFGVQGKAQRRAMAIPFQEIATQPCAAKIAIRSVADSPRR
jgi:hypothetical protein